MGHFKRPSLSTPCRCRQRSGVGSPGNTNETIPEDTHPGTGPNPTPCVLRLHPSAQLSFYTQYSFSHSSGARVQRQHKTLNNHDLAPSPSPWASLGECWSSECLPVTLASGNEGCFPGAFHIRLKYCLMKYYSSQWAPSSLPSRAAPTIFLRGP